MGVKTCTFVKVYKVLQFHILKFIILFFIYTYYVLYILYIYNTLARSEISDQNINCIIFSLYIFGFSLIMANNSGRNM